jgi:hypothetical protein
MQLKTRGLVHFVFCYSTIDSSREQRATDIRRVANADSEGFNSRIQSIKSAVTGFRNFDNNRTRILFFCGKLDVCLESP